MPSGRVPRFILTATLESGRTFEFTAERTREECAVFCHEVALHGLWAGDMWFPPSQIRSIRCDKLL